MTHTREVKQSTEWVKCSERLPAKQNADPFGNVYVQDHKNEVVLRQWNDIYIYDKAWMPTGLVRPEPPDMLAEREKETRR